MRTSKVINKQLIILFNSSIVINVIIILVLSMNYYFNDNSEYNYIWIMVSIVSILLFVCLFQVTIIYNDKIKIIYPLRIFYRHIRLLQYDQITKIICRIPTSKGDSPRLELFLLNQNKKVIIKYDNINRHKLYELLVFLNSKIDIIEVYGTNNNTIEDLKNTNVKVRYLWIILLSILLIVSFL